MTRTSYQPAARNDGLPADYGRNPERPWERRPRDGAGPPWTVTVASLIAFAFAAFHAFLTLAGIDVLQHWNLVASHATLSHGRICFDELINAVFGLSLLWGGYAAWRGLDRKALFFYAVGVLSWHIIAAIVAGAWHAIASPHLYDYTLLIIALLATPSSRNYFRARNGELT